MSVLVVVQARTGSTRLPGKVLLPLAGKPLLARMLERLRAVRSPFELVVATTTDASDDPVAALAASTGTRVHRGHPTDLLDRHVQAARAAGADVVVKIPSDCPLIAPEVVERVLGVWHARAETERLDFVSNLHPATYPDGNDVEVVRGSALEAAWREAQKPYEREHTTPFVWDQPERFRSANVTWETGLDYATSHRFTIDYPEDYAFIAAVYDALWTSERPVFSLADILELLAARPELLELNARHHGKSWFQQHWSELKTASTLGMEPGVTP
ncbi:MAG TPA: glycosyltransferase family protein [Polyangiaceae bacterium]|nr:glycosyltransferase family protein [Polyangiaceae bacterium]